MNLNLDKFSVEYVKNQMAAVSFETVALIILAVSSFLYGIDFGGELIGFMPGVPSAVVAGMIMVVFFDWAANRWDAKTTASGSSQQQLVISDWMRWICLGCSITVSVLYLVTSMSFLNLSAYEDGLGALGIFLVTGVIIANALGIYIHRSQSPENLEAKRTAEEEAATAAVEFQNRKLISEVRLKGKIYATKVISKKVYENILAESANLAKRESDSITEDWNREWNSYDDDDFNITDADIMANEVASDPDAGAPTPAEEMEPLDIDLTPDDGSYIPTPGPGK